jgi:MoaA/NifB/PqqE/SkfB family radical SAM enzyme
MNTNMMKLAIKHFKNDLMEEVYLKTGIDKTKPISFYGIVNEKCNYKCRYCDYWRLKNYVDEMSIDEWKKALLSIKDFVGSFHIQFSGGEPFIKKGFIDLLEFCNENNIQWGVVTNGSCLTDSVIKRIVAANPFNINISTDGPDAEIHDYSRGVIGSLNKIKKSIQKLAEEKNLKNKDFPIVIKPTIHSKNLHTMTEMPKWAMESGATSINFQPLDRWTTETYDELWINEDRFPEIEQVVENLIQQKNQGAPIINSSSLMRLWPAHFREEKAPESVGSCRVGLRNYFIRTDGSVEVCWFYPTIGNVKNQSAKEIWESYEAKIRRKETTDCDRLCLYTCLSQKTLVDKIKMGKVMFLSKSN